MNFKIRKLLLFLLLIIIFWVKADFVFADIMPGWCVCCGEEIRCASLCWDCQKPIPNEPSCFLPETKIRTQKDDKNIEDLKIGEQVRGFLEGNGKLVTARVTNIFKSFRDSYYFLKTKAEKEVKVTAEHPFLISLASKEETAYKEVKDLRIGDKVYIYDKGKLIADEIVKKEKINESTPVYNLAVDTTHNFIANDFAVHNKCPYKNFGTLEYAGCDKFYGWVIGSDIVNNEVRFFKDFSGDPLGAAPLFTAPLNIYRSDLEQIGCSGANRGFEIQTPLGKGLFDGQQHTIKAGYVRYDSDERKHKWVELVYSPVNIFCYQTNCGGITENPDPVAKGNDVYLQAINYSPSSGAENKEVRYYIRPSTYSNPPNNCGGWTHIGTVSIAGQSKSTLTVNTNNLNPGTYNVIAEVEDTLGRFCNGYYNYHTCNPGSLAFMCYSCNTTFTVVLPAGFTVYARQVNSPNAACSDIINAPSPTGFQPSFTPHAEVLLNTNRIADGNFNPSWTVNTLNPDNTYNVTFNAPAAGTNFMSSFIICSRTGSSGSYTRTPSFGTTNTSINFKPQAGTMGEIHVAYIPRRQVTGTVKYRTDSNCFNSGTLFNLATITCNNKNASYPSPGVYRCINTDNSFYFDPLSTVTIDRSADPAGYEYKCSFISDSSNASTSLPRSLTVPINTNGTGPTLIYTRISTLTVRAKSVNDPNASCTTVSRADGPNRSFTVDLGTPPTRYRFSNNLITKSFPAGNVLIDPVNPLADNTDKLYMDSYIMCDGNTRTPTSGTGTGSYTINLGIGKTFDVGYVKRQKVKVRVLEAPSDTCPSSVDVLTDITSTIYTNLSFQCTSGQTAVYNSTDRVYECKNTDNSVYFDPLSTVFFGSYSLPSTYSFVCYHNGLREAARTTVPTNGTAAQHYLILTPNKPRWFQVVGGDVHANGGGVTSQIPATATNRYFLGNSANAKHGVVSSTGILNLGSESTIPTHVSVDADKWYANNSGSYGGKAFYSYDFWKKALAGKLETVTNPQSFNPKNKSGLFDFGGNGSNRIEIKESSGGGNWKNINKKIFILYNGTIKISNDISVDSGGSLVIVASVNIEIDHRVEELAGYFIAGGNINTGHVSGGVDQQLTVNGGLIAQNKVNLQRDLGTNNKTTPAEIVNFRPDILVNLNDDLKFKEIKRWQEVAP